MREAAIEETGQGERKRESELGRVGVAGRVYTVASLSWVCVSD